MADTNAEPRYSRILQAVASTPWAITMEKWAAIVEVLTLRASGVRFTAEEIRERLGAREVREDDETELSAASSGGARTVGSVAVIPLRGTLIPRADLLTEASGGTSLERWTMAFRQAVADPGVNAIVIDV